MNNINYQKILDETIETLKNKKEVPKLLLHSCCAPCSSYVLEYLSKYFKITVFYYNPNISPKVEYDHRVEEIKRLISSMHFENEVNFVEGKYDTDTFFNMSKGLENLKEGGERCFKCYELRLKESAYLAEKLGMDYFTTTLSISPYKNAEKLNEIGESISKDLNVKYLFSDFKKRNGYKRSIELSKEYNLYRQNYCGCVFSKRDADLKMTKIGE
ncbi:epoxyqueuosine reductase QueH [Clostridium sp. BJN0001]|uniref:epoxyqueuosine reductase QueH n=1 Tax=Clostridium sp. BJN0001 TaxID=2930219 RepID=UPI001FD0FA5E|nr:epoxyqueuosine reductase QueH [Clostridium sp. BJN0001]